MRLDIYGLFVVSVITPKGGWSKGRRVAVIEDRDACQPIDLLIPNNLTEDQLRRYLTDRFSTFAKPGSEIRRLDVANDQSPAETVDDRKASKFVEGSRAFGTKTKVRKLHHVPAPGTMTR